MDEEERDADHGGPLRARGVPPSFAQVPPSVAEAYGVSHSRPGAGGGNVQASGVPGVVATRINAVYGYHARSPLPHLAAAMVAGVGTLWAVLWAQGSGEPVGRAEALFFYTFQVLTPFVDETGGSVAMRNRIAVAAALVTLVTLVALISRLGRNLRHQSLWAGLALFALPSWFVLPLIVDLNGGARDTYGTTITMLTITLVLVLLQFGLLRAALYRNLWSVLELPGAAWSAVLWLPSATTLGLYFGSGLYTLIAIGSDGRGTSGWEPTERMFDGVIWTGRAADAALVIIVAAGAMHQHMGIGRERQAEREASGR